MVNHFIDETDQDSSGFFLNEFEALKLLLSLKTEVKRTHFMGCDIRSCLDFAEKFQMDFPSLIIMETGGMKGRREEMIRADVHDVLKVAFHVENVHSEYGMTELFSQAYSLGRGYF